jgi:hypothetical protein
VLLEESRAVLSLVDHGITRTRQAAGLARPRFDFTDAPFRHSPPVTLAFTATGDRPAAVLTGPRHRRGDWPGPADPAAGSAGMVRARVEGSPLTAAATLTWPGDLCRSLKQVLFDAADGITFSPCHADPAAGAG